MIVYQLFVRGMSLAGWPISRYSKKVFRERGAAEGHVPTFLELVTNEKELDSLDRDGAYTVKILELELVDF